MHNVSPDFIP